MTTSNIDIGILKQLSICHADLIIEWLNLDLRDQGSYYNGVCPVHAGNNETAFSFLKHNATWKCWTNQCEVTYGNDIIGLVRGVHGCHFRKAIEILSECIDYKDDEDTRERIKNQKFISKEQYRYSIVVNKEEVLPEALVEALNWDVMLDEYLVETRGFSKEILQELEVGYVDDPTSSFWNRAVFPVRNKRGFLVGFTGRFVSMEENEVKWLNRGMLNSYLYGYHLALPHIEKLQSIILVEGPLGVARLRQAGIYNAVGIFGVGLSDRQRLLILESGAFDVWVLLDNDKAGRKGADKIVTALSKYFYIRKIDLGKHADVDEMEIEEIKELFYD